MVAWAITRNKRYLKIAWLGIQVILLLAVAFGLVYVFGRVLLI